MNCKQCNIPIRKNDDWKILFKKYSVLYNILTQSTTPEFCIKCMELTIDDLQSECETSGKLSVNAIVYTKPSVIKLDKNTIEYSEISNKFMAKRTNGKIIVIEKILNKNLSNKFYEAIHGKDGKIEYLFHASQNDNYDNIIVNGFDISKSKQSGSLGPGIYGAKYSTYSDAFSSSLPTKTNNETPENVRITLMCNFFLDKTHKTLYENTNDQIFAVFNESYTNPMFLIYHIADRR